MDTEITGARGLPTFERLPVLAIAGAVGMLLLVTSAFGGYWFDELYFIAAGRHASWGYADQPWLVPMLASGLDILFPDSLIALRLPATLSAVAGVVVAALTAREFGGRRLAQVLSAGAYATSLWTLVSAHWLVTYTLDPVWWTTITWLVVRWTRMRNHGIHDDRPLLWAGIVTAIALQTKFLVPVLWLGLGFGALLVGPRELLRRPLLWAGAAIAVLATVPTLVWQTANGWPYLEFSRVVGAESRRLDFLTGLPVLAGLVGTAFILYALWRLFRSDLLRPYRFLGFAFVITIVIFVVADGRSYYPVGMHGVLFAIAAVELERRDLVRWWQWVAWPAYAVSAVAAVGALLLATSTAGSITERATVEPVADAFHSLSPEQRSRTALVAEIYPSAATIDHYADELRLPPAYSPHRGYWYFGAPPASADTVLYVSVGNVDRVRPYFASARKLSYAGSEVWLLEGRRQPWSTVWPRLRSGLSAN